MSLEKANQNTANKFKKLSLFLSITVVAIGFIVLVGWAQDVKFFKSLLPNWVSMKANTAYCFLLAGICLIIFNTEKPKSVMFSIAYLFSIIIIFMASTILIEYSFDLNVGIDDFFLKDSKNLTERPGRLAFESAICFLLLGISFVLSGVKRINIILIQSLCLFAGLIATTVLIGYLLNVNQFTDTETTSKMTFYSSFSFIILVLATLFLRPEEGLIKIILSKLSSKRS